ncbi:MAG: histidine kinase [Flavobacteriales bacterium]|nr:histidine kinase [Flavobacteriales bacterium]
MPQIEISQKEWEEYQSLLEQSDKIDLVIYTSFIPVILVFIFLFFVVYRNRREKEFRKREFALQLARSDMEMKALRSQVNPHFIFNCLASIQNFVALNDNRQAEYYLVRFSGLIRQVLENSTEKMVPISDDVEALEKYVEMEKLRLDNVFNFTLSIDESIDAETTFIPPLIIQPLVENAIWHGVGDDGTESQIDVEIKRGGNEIIECITVNKSASESRQTERHTMKKKSLGMALIRERLQLLSSLYDGEFTLSINDIGEMETEESFGKRVRMLIPCELE